MTEYHKIQSVYKRDKKGGLLPGSWTMPEFEYLCRNDWVYTEKIDGTNIRIMYNLDGNKGLVFGGRTERAQIPADLVNALNQQFMPLLPKFIEKFDDAPVILFGEGYGPKIQKVGAKYRSTPGFILFDIRIGTWWLKREDVTNLAMQFGLEVVPIIGVGDLYQMVDMAIDGFNSLFGEFEAEGIVARPKVELRARSGARMIAKIKCKDFWYESKT